MLLAWKIDIPKCQFWILVYLNDVPSVVKHCKILYVSSSSISDIESIIECHAVSQSQISYTVGWPTLQSPRDYLKCMLVFKSLHGLDPAYLLNDISHACDFHSYNTRHRDLLSLPLARTTKYQGSFRSSGAKIWNTLPLSPEEQAWFK